MQTGTTHSHVNPYSPPRLRNVTMEPKKKIWNILSIKKSSGYLNKSLTRLYLLGMYILSPTHQPWDQMNPSIYPLNVLG